MAIKWNSSEDFDGGRFQLQISHDLNGLSNDVLNQEIALLHDINKASCTRVRYIGLLSNSETAQRDTRLIRKFGLWSHEQKTSYSSFFNDSTLNFHSTISVGGGICFFGGFVADPSHFSEVIVFAQKLSPIMFVWNNNRDALIQYFENIEESKLIFQNKEFLPQLQVTNEVLIDLCRSTESFICIPNLDIDVSDANFVVIDPLSMVTPYLEQFK